ncbi:MAG: Uncharacterized protein G01um101477_565 [Candidatus Doudnabacteria bacterium Gr01-1014_77]|uniref:CYTH domain-containing protein n=1 Tax=Candidatus Doudnabacteria bacterium Gr01-1014_77 TaxID=2017133 RepID=A0A554JA37_9BACT|nr:MAG: Uncharacterized protein G01um101477_565 [Candidatus Doudnabacteria bacterium Gr01-1014_77]
MEKKTYEIELKSLLGNPLNAEKLVSKMKELDPKMVSKGSHKQLNHYFKDGNLHDLYEKLSEHVQPEKKSLFKEVTEKAKTFSVRTRWADGKVILVIKASVDETTSSNGTARLEFESLMNMTLEELDSAILASGFNYQAKWSRERTDYAYKDTAVSIDKNAGYGYLAEFEKTETELENVEPTKVLLREMLKELDIQELPQDRLERMFAFYNDNWQDYYGTEKTFNIE